MSAPYVSKGHHNGVPGEFSTVDLGRRVETMFFPDDGSAPSTIGVSIVPTLQQIQAAHLE